MKISPNRKKLPIKEFLGSKYDESLVTKLLEENQILLFPEEYAGQILFSKDIIDLVKDLRNNGIAVYPILRNANIIEKNAEDIILHLGIISITASISTIMSLVGRYLYEKYVVTNKSEDVPEVKFTYYRNKTEEYVSYEGKADKLVDALQNIKDDEQ